MTVALGEVEMEEGTITREVVAEGEEEAEALATVVGAVNPIITRRNEILFSPRVAEHDVCSMTGSLPPARQPDNSQNGCSCN